MYYKVRIKKLPTAATGRETKTGQQKDGALTIQPTAMGGADIDQYIGKEPMRIKDTLEPVDREEANLEAERGETAYGDLNGDGFPEHYKIGGKRHVAGGTPLNLPDDTFIFSDTKSMKINDPNILSKFGKSTAKGKKSKGYTPAELAKQYDINKFRKILQDPDSDSVSKKTAEIMIRNYNEKLGALSLAQEAKKGYPQGIPMVAKPYMQAMGIKEEDIMPTYKPRQAEQGMEAAEGMPPEMMEQGMGQEDMGQEQMPMPENIPQQMPDGQQIAMTPEMMQGAPMAMYGMSMGGYGIPFAQDGMMTYGNGGLYRAQEGVETNEETETAPKGSPVKPPYGEREAYSPKGVVELNKYRKMYGLPQLSGSVTQAQIKAAAGELQAKIIESNPDLVIDYMSRRTHKPNNKLLGILPRGYEKTTEGVKKAIEDGKLTTEAVKNAYKDDLWWYRALETNTKELSKEEYEKKMKDPNAIKQGDILYFNEDPNNPQLYTQYVMKEEAKKDDKIDVPEAEKEEDAERDPIEDVDIQEPYQQPLAWTGIDKRNLNAAVTAKYNRKKYYPWAPMVDLETPAPDYVDPTGALQQQGAMANTMVNQLAQFTGGQGLSARASSIQGQLANQATETLANYNNQNVGIKNQFSQVAANTRNQNRLQNQAIAKGLYDDNVKMNQQWDIGTQGYNAGILAMMNTGDKNAADIYNTSSMSDQYGIDPETLAYYFKGGKDIQPEAESNSFNDMVKYYIQDMGFDPKDAVAAATQAMKSQKGAMPGVNVDAIMQNYAKNGGMFVIGSNLMPQLLL